MSGTSLSRINALPMTLPVSQEQLVEDARMQRSADACIALIVAGSPAGADSPFRPLAELELPGGLPRWLNHMREATPALYQHSLRVALVASAFGALNQLDWRKRQALAMAGLFHDLGHLKVEALATVAEGELDTTGLYQLRSHPVVSHLILSNVEGVPPEVARAVREHHERLDGSGYPAGLVESRISVSGQLLALAETVVGIIDKGLAAQLPVKLRLQRGKYHLRTLTWVTTLFAEHGPRPDVDKFEPAAIAARLRDIEEWMLSLAALQLPGDGTAEAGEGWLAVQVAALRRGLISIGIDPGAPEAVLDVVREDQALCTEISVVIAEALVQIKFMIREAVARIARDAGGLAAVRGLAEWERLEALRRQVVEAMPGAVSNVEHELGD